MIVEVTERHARRWWPRFAGMWRALCEQEMWERHMARAGFTAMRRGTWWYVVPGPWEREIPAHPTGRRAPTEIDAYFNRTS